MKRMVDRSTKRRVPTSCILFALLLLVSLVIISPYLESVPNWISASLTPHQTNTSKVPEQGYPSQTPSQSSSSGITNQSNTSQNANQGNTASQGTTPQNSSQVNASQIVVQDNTSQNNKPQWEKSSYHIFLSIPKEVAATGSLQHVENIIVSVNATHIGTASILDSDGNRFIVVYWNDSRLNVAASIEAIVTRKVNSSLSIDGFDYPIQYYGLPPESVETLTEPTYFCQSDDPRIIQQAKDIAGNSTDEAEIVDSVISWVRDNIEDKSPQQMKDEKGYFWVDAAQTLEYRQGVYVGFSHLTIALLRSLGIPARYVQGIVTDPNNRYPIEAYGCQAWVQVYYPKVGWVDYDAKLGDANPPNHFVYCVFDHCYGDYGVSNAPHYTELWRETGLGNNTIKIQNTVKVSSN
jgi:hypothetical protein